MQCGWPALVGWRFLCVCAFDGFLLWVRIASACPTIASLCNNLCRRYRLKGAGCYWHGKLHVWHRFEYHPILSGAGLLLYMSVPESYLLSRLLAHDLSLCAAISLPLDAPMTCTHNCNLMLKLTLRGSGYTSTRAKPDQLAAAVEGIWALGSSGDEMLRQPVATLWQSFRLHFRLCSKATA